MVISGGICDPFITPVELESCIYCDDTNTSDPGPNSRYISSLIVDGVEYAPSPISTVGNFILIGAVLWNTGLVDAINDLNIPTFFAEYPSIADFAIIDSLANIGPIEHKPKNSIRITNEIGKTFSLVVGDSILVDGNFMITEDQVFLRQSGVWVNIPDATFYPFTRKGCVTG